MEDATNSCVDSTGDAGEHRKLCINVLIERACRGRRSGARMNENVAVCEGHSDSDDRRGCVRDALILCRSYVWGIPMGLRMVCVVKSLRLCVNGYYILCIKKNFREAVITKYFKFHIKHIAHRT